jgi:hypothetical protein
MVVLPVPGPTSGRLSAEARSGAMRPLEAGTPFLLFNFHSGCYRSPHEDLGRDR